MPYDIPIYFRNQGYREGFGGTEGFDDKLFGVRADL